MSKGRVFEKKQDKDIPLTSHKKVKHRRERMNAYIRVSTEEQNLARQLEQMKERGIQDRNIFQEKKSGRNLEREELQKLLNIVREGDSITVTEISRLGRNMRDIVNVVYDLESRGVNIISIKENVDTSTEMGKVFFTISGIFAEIERNSILERQKQGIAIAKREGRMTGRPRCLCENFEKVYKQYKEGKIQLEQALKLLECSRSTFYRRVKQYTDNEYRLTYERKRIEREKQEWEEEDSLIDF